MNIITVTYIICLALLTYNNIDLQNKQKTHVPSFQNQRSSADSIGQTKAVRRKWPKWHTPIVASRPFKLTIIDQLGGDVFLIEDGRLGRPWTPETGWLLEKNLPIRFELKVFKGQYLSLGIILCSSQNLRWPTCREQIGQCYQRYEIYRSHWLKNGRSKI